LSAKRNAFFDDMNYLHADCTALFVHEAPELSQLPAEERQAVEKHLRFARSLQIETRILGGGDIAKTVVEFARGNQVTQIFVTHAQVRLLELRRRNFTEKIVRLVQDLQLGTQMLWLPDTRSSQTFVESVGEIVERWAAGIELKVPLRLRKLLILQIGNVAQTPKLAEARYTAGTR